MLFSNINTIRIEHLLNNNNKYFNNINSRIFPVILCRLESLKTKLPVLKHVMALASLVLKVLIVHHLPCVENNGGRLLSRSL